MGILDTVRSHLGPSTIDQIGRHLGVDTATAQRAIAVAAPLVLAGMARHSAKADGAATIHQAAQSHAGALENVEGMLGAGPPADNTGLLSMVLGQHRGEVQQSVQQASGLDSDRARQLLLMLSPLVLGALARQHFDGQVQANPEQLNATLAKEAPLAQQEIQKAAPGLGGLLGRLF